MPTIKDVARASGVCPATVSQVLHNGRRPVHALTRERVIKAARELDYRPNAIARGLARKRMNTVGVVFLHDSGNPNANPFLISVLSGILAVNTARNQQTTLCTMSGWDNSLDHLSDLCDGRCDGIIILVPPSESPLVDALRKRNVPLAIVSGNSLHENTCEVDIDHAGGAYAMTMFLLEEGHRRISFVYEPYHLDFAFLKKRRAGSRQAVADFGLSADAFTEITEDQAAEIAAIPSAIRPTAYFCSHDSLAL
jgi:DNA-binding LacI/PurR family transcriptional regulator